MPQMLASTYTCVKGIVTTVLNKEVKYIDITNTPELIGLRPLRDEWYYRQNRVPVFLEEVAMEEIKASRCQHHWLLEDPSGPMVKGCCQTCGATKQFPVELHRRVYGRNPQEQSPWTCHSSSKINARFYPCVAKSRRFVRVRLPLTVGYRED